MPDNTTGCDDTSVNLSAYWGDPPVRWLIHRAGIKPFQAGLLTFCLGIGVMACWYLAMKALDDPAARLKGQFDYFATYADSLALPLISVTIFEGYRASHLLFHGASAQERSQILSVLASRWWVMLTLCAVVVGIGSFYFVPATPWEVNWTSPTPGTLNGPGWYHAAFMFAQLYLILGFVVRQGVTIALGWQYPQLVHLNYSSWAEHARRLVQFAILLVQRSGRAYRVMVEWVG